MLQLKTQHNQINTLKRERLVLNTGSPNVTLSPRLSKKEKSPVNTLTRLSLTQGTQRLGGCASEGDPP